MCTAVSTVSKFQSCTPKDVVPQLPETLSCSSTWVSHCEINSNLHPVIHTWQLHHLESTQINFQPGWREATPLLRPYCAKQLQRVKQQIQRTGEDFAKCLLKVQRATLLPTMSSEAGIQVEQFNISHWSVNTVVTTLNEGTHSQSNHSIHSCCSTLKVLRETWRLQSRKDIQ